jgi:hypothetical protein
MDRYRENILNQKAYEHVQAETPIGSFYLALAVKQYLLVLQISVPSGQKPWIGT